MSQAFFFLSCIYTGISMTLYIENSREYKYDQISKSCITDSGIDNKYLIVYLLNSGSMQFILILVFTNMANILLVFKQMPCYK